MRLFRGFPVALSRSLCCSFGVSLAHDPDSFGLSFHCSFSLELGTETRAFHASSLGVNSVETVQSRPS